MSGKTVRERLIAELKYIKVSKTYLCVCVLVNFLFWVSLGFFGFSTYLYTCILFDTPCPRPLAPCIPLSVILKHAIHWEV
jgi:hypothetical protein